MRKAAKPALLLLLVATLCGAQQESLPKFIARTELVTVPVVVLWHGEHITGLKPADFEVDEDGRPQKIASFEEIRAASAPLSVVKPPPGIHTNEVAAEGPVTLTVIVLDLINTPYLSQDTAKSTLLEYLQTQFRGDRPTMLAVMHTGGLRILHDFTSDPKILADIVRRLKSRVEHEVNRENDVKTEMSDAMSKEIDIAAEYAAIAKEFEADLSPQDAYTEQLKRNRLEMTFSELQQLAHGLASLRGMKSLVWVCGRMVLPSSVDWRSRKLWDEYAQTIRLLSAANVSVYPIDTVLDTFNPTYRSAENRMPVSTQLPLNSTLQGVQNFMDISRSTGGDFCLLKKDPARCFTKAVDYTAQYYLLTYYARPGTTVEWRKIHVKVRGEGLTVRARSGYFSSGSPVESEERRKKDIALATYSPIEYRDLAIAMRWNDNPTPAADGKRPFLLEVASDSLTVDAGSRNHIRVSVIAVALDRSGNVVGDMAQQLDLHPTAPELDRLRKQGLVYANAIAVPERAVQVRFVVRDDLSEKIGTVSAVLKAE